MPYARDDIIAPHDVHCKMWWQRVMVPVSVGRGAESWWLSEIVAFSTVYAVVISIFIKKILNEITRQKAKNIKVGAGGKLDFNCRWNYQNLCTQKLKYVHNSNKLQSDMKIQKYQCGRWWIFSIAVFNQGVFFIQREFVCVVFHLFIFFF